jgi:hypothetical protein
VRKSERECSVSVYFWFTEEALYLRGRFRFKAR